MRTLLLALLASLSLTACATAEDPTSSGADLQNSADVEHVVVTDVPTFAPGTRTATDDHSGGTEACACQTDECRAEWINTNLGCGVCATFECGSEDGFEQCVSCPPAQTLDDTHGASSLLTPASND
jgi:hypothetical protein